MGKRTKTDREADALIEVVELTPGGEVQVEGSAVPRTVGDVIASVVDSVVPAAWAAGPHKFGVEFRIRTDGDGSAVLAEEGGKATFRVFMEWSRSHEG